MVLWSTDHFIPKLELGRRLDAIWHKKEFHGFPDVKMEVGVTECQNSYNLLTPTVVNNEFIGINITFDTDL